jgi:hypothetical protein
MGMSVSTPGEHVTNRLRPLATEYRSFRPTQDLTEQYGPEQSHSRCLNVTAHMVNQVTGETRPVLCRNKVCVACNRLTYRPAFRDAVHLAGPTHMLTLTGLSGIWPDDQHRINLLFRRLRRGGGLHVVYAIEPNPQETGFHAHGWMYDSPTQPGLWTEQARAVGLGMVMIKEVTYNGDYAYPVKATTWNADSLRRYLAANGSHRHHKVGQFFRDARTGATFGAYEDAAAARRGLSPSARAHWTYQPLHRRARLSGLTPTAAARIRKANQARQRIRLVSVQTGEVLLTMFPTPVEEFVGDVVIGPISVFVQGRETGWLWTDAERVEVRQVAA